VKLLDDKGRILGSINIIDAFVIALAVLLLAGGYFKFVAQGSITDATHFQEETRVTVRHETREKGKLTAFEIGDQLVAQNRLQPIYIEEVKVNPLLIMVEKEDGPVEKEHPFKKEMYITFRGKANITEADIHMANQIVKIGAEFYLKTQTAEILGTVSHIQY